MPHPIPPAQPHTDLHEVLPDVFTVRGSMRIGPMAFTRNMTVVRTGEDLVIVNSVRLNHAGLAQLDALGTVRHVIRIAGFHGSDDRFYKQHYDAPVWAVKGQTYFAGVDPKKGAIYFEADKLLDADDELPIPGAALHVFTTDPPEGLLQIPAGGGTLIPGDSLQNWTNTGGFNLLAKVGMRLAGFIKPCALGAGWIKSARPDPKQLSAVLDLDFANVLPAHGEPVLGNARERFRPAIEGYANRTR